MRFICQCCTVASIIYPAVWHVAGMSLHILLPYYYCICSLKVVFDRTLGHSHQYSYNEAKGCIMNMDISYKHNLWYYKLQNERLSRHFQEAYMAIANICPRFSHDESCFCQYSDFFKFTLEYLYADLYRSRFYGFKMWCFFALHVLGTDLVSACSPFTCHLFHD